MTCKWLPNAVVLLACAALSCDAAGGATRVAEHARTDVQRDSSSDSAAVYDVPCTTPESLGSLAPPLRESSGVAPASRRGHYWTHNDSEDPATLYRIDLRGRIAQRVTVAGAHPKDWEDIAAARCGSSTCLYLADIGDNLYERATVRVLRVREPGTRDRTTSAAEVFPFRYPDGPTDAEAIFVLPGERLYVISKGRNRAAALYRYPGRLRPATVTLERVRTFTEGIAQFPEMVTGASASRDGHHVAVRSYRFIDLYRVHDAELVHSGRVSLESLAERQGEGVALGPGDQLVLVGERADRHAGSIASVRCALPR